MGKAQALYSAWTIARIMLFILGAALLLNSIVTAVIFSARTGVLLSAFLGLPLFLWGLFYWPIKQATSHGFGCFLKWLLICAYILFLLSFVFCLLLMMKAARQRVEPGADAVIVLGAGLRGEKVSEVLRLRLDRAYEYWAENPNAIILLSGGKGENELCSEASAMKNYLLGRAVPETNMLLEDQSRSTRENFSFSKKCLDAYFSGKPYRCIFVSSPFHVFRAEKIAKKANLDLQGIAGDNSLKLAINNYLREYVSIVHHFVFGYI